MELEGLQFLRVVLQNDEPWFVAADVCKALELSDTNMTLKRLDDDEKGTSSICTPGGNQKMSIVNEPGLYSLVLGSRKPESPQNFLKQNAEKPLTKLNPRNIINCDYPLSSANKSPRIWDTMLDRIGP